MISNTKQIIYSSYLLVFQNISKLVLLFIPTAIFWLLLPWAGDIYDRLTYKNLIHFSLLLFGFYLYCRMLFHSQSTLWVSSYSTKLSHFSRRDFGLINKYAGCVFLPLMGKFGLLLFWNYFNLQGELAELLYLAAALLLVYPMTRISLAPALFVIDLTAYSQTEQPGSREYWYFINLSWQFTRGRVARITSTMILCNFPFVCLLIGRWIYMMYPATVSEFIASFNAHSGKLVFPLMPNELVTGIWVPLRYWQHGILSPETTLAFVFYVFACIAIITYVWISLIATLQIAKSIMEEQLFRDKERDRDWDGL